MAFCSKCGFEVLNGEKFCEKCGTPIRSNGGNNSSRKQQFEGDLHKCPNCGAAVKSFETVCTACGHEFRNSNASTAIKELETEVKKITKSRGRTKFEKNYQIASLITSFAIPNTKEDLYEFAALASANIKAAMLTGFKQPYMSDEEFTSEKNLSEAWYSKLKHVHAKAGMSFKKEAEYQTINGILQEINHEIKTIKTERKREKKKAERNKKGNEKSKVIVKYSDGDSGFLIGMVVITLLFFAFVYFAVFAPIIKEESELKAKEKEISQTYVAAEEYLTNGDFDEALEKARSIPAKGFSNEWESKQNDLINRIERAKLDDAIEKHISTGKKVKVPAKAGKLEGEDYNDVITQLKNAGFLYIATETIADVSLGIFTSVGEVEKVSINGITNFSKGDEFPEEAKVIVTYHIES